MAGDGIAHGDHANESTGMEKNRDTTFSEHIRIGLWGDDKKCSKRLAFLATFMIAMGSHVRLWLVRLIGFLDCYIMLLRTFI